MYTKSKSIRELFARRAFLTCKRISIKFAIDVKFAIMKGLTRAFLIFQIEKKYMSNF